MEALRKFENRLTSEICDCLILEDAIKNDLNNFLNIKLDIEHIAGVRKSVLDRFKQMMNKNTNELYDENNVRLNMICFLNRNNKFSILFYC